MKKTDLIKIILLWCLVALLSAKVQPRTYTGGTSQRLQSKAEVKQSALGIMLGEFRTNLSDMFYMQTENFMHYGVAFLPHNHEEHSHTSDMLTDTGMAHIEGEDETHDHDHGHDHERDHDDDHDGDPHHDHEHEVITVIPTAEKDYRSWLGNLHRQIKPWQAPGESHQLARDVEVVPLFRMMTLADPHYVRGYQVGAFWIQQLDVSAAADFIEEGLQNNPHSFELYLMRGLLNVKKARSMGEQGLIDNGNAAQQALLECARGDFQQAAEYMMQVRPALEVLEDEAQTLWSDDQETDAMAVVYLWVTLEKRIGNEARALELAEKYCRVMPDHKQLHVLLQEMGP